MRVAIVSGVVVAHDAISAAVAKQASLLASMPGVERVTVFAQHIDRHLDVDGVVVGDPWQLVRLPSFAECDTVILHWGIFYTLFDVITLLSNRRVAVHFHNCTPVELVPETERGGIVSSQTQIAHAISLGVRLWTFSDFNEQTLLSWGADRSRIDFVPFPIDVPLTRPRRRSAGESVGLLSVGRFVPAKGQLTLLEAVAQLDVPLRQRLRVTLAGSRTFSDVEYVRQIESAIAARDLADQVRIVEDADDVELWDLYRGHDVVISTSWHEGLCVPVIEGYAAGCIAIGTTAGNVPFLVTADDEVTPPGDSSALVAAIERAVRRVDAGSTREQIERRHSVARRFSSDSCRHAMSEALHVQ